MAMMKGSDKKLTSVLEPRLNEAYRLSLIQAFTLDLRLLDCGCEDASQLRGVSEAFLEGLLQDSDLSLRCAAWIADTLLPMVLFAVDWEGLVQGLVRGLGLDADRLVACRS